MQRKTNLTWDLSNTYKNFFLPKYFFYLPSEEQSKKKCYFKMWLEEYLKLETGKNITKI